jgi:hypothetical protein
MRVKVLRILFFCLIVFLAVPEFRIGYSSLADGIRARGDLWSVRHNYFADAAFGLIPGVLALLCASMGAFFAKRLNWLYSLLATGIVFYMAVAIPSFYGAPQARARSSVNGRMLDLKSAVESYATEKGGYPRTSDEVELALRPARFDYHSPYQRKGVPVEYQIVPLAGATGPALGAARPALLHYAVDAAGTRYWITGTMLPAAVSDHAIILSGYGEAGPLVVEGKLEPPSPPPPPAPTKTPPAKK